jgi:signal transduction histidine kinase
VAIRWSIRNQILIPLIAIQGLAVAVNTLTTARLAASRGERQIIDRLNGVITALGHANFPYTASVLVRMHGLSGAHFVACDADGRPSETSLAGLRTLPTVLSTVPDAADLDSLGAAPTLPVGGTRYFALRLRPAHGARGPSLLVLYPETSWRQARREAALPPLLLGVGSLGLLVAVTCWVAHRYSRRLGRVQRQVARIAEGDFQELDLGRTRDEVQDLARSINQMCVQLREMRRAIRQTERTRLLAQLAAGLAHQLRNSLTGARMSVQLHARRYPAPEGDRSLDVALRQLAMTEEQVRGLLSLGRVEQRPPSEFDAGRLLDDVAMLVEPTCRHARVTLRRQRGAGPLDARGDESGIRAAVLNLTLNAIEAAGPGGRVGLEVHAAGAEVSFDVSDSGPGPPPELAESLCEPFVTGKPDGVGLGLALAQQVAVEHRGRLSWTRAEGETRFRLSIPRSEGTLKEAV